MIEQNFIKLYENSFKDNWELPALTDYKVDNATYTYGDIAREIAKLHILFSELGIKKGDKIALIGKNHSSWAMLFMATITYGAVIVPILHEFNPKSMETLIDHSDSKLIFINKNIWDKIHHDGINVPVFEVPNYTLIKGIDENTQAICDSIDGKFKEKYPKGFEKEDISYADVGNEEVVCINYTSGTTGYSKGVMITANNFAGNITYAPTMNVLFRGDRTLAFLPMAHVYGCSFDFLFPLSIGAHITLLGAIPAPITLIKAFKEVKPSLIISVPLIFEKIYKKELLPIISKPAIKVLLKIPGINTLIYKKMNESLTESLGGNFREVIIGGAALSAEVEDLFHKMKFPFTVGYGMTECAPLVAHDRHFNFVPRSCGSVLDILDVRIDSEDPENIPGEIQLRGENVMKGYYKNPEATAEAFTEDGWLKTGDSGILRGRRLFIKGRIKTMILSANGQNIYPEEIESRLNNMPYIIESIVVLRNSRLIAIVYPDFKAIEADNISESELEQIMKENKEKLNHTVAQYERIADIEIRKTEFEKTPKQSIKRFLYT